MHDTFEPNPRAAAGGNNPPDPALEAYEAHKVNCEDLYAEAKNWCDGEPITTQEQADEVGKLLGMLREAATDAEKARKAEVKPLDEAKTAVQARWNELIGDTTKVKGIVLKAQDACKAALAPWLRKKEEEQRAAAEAARKEAEEKAAAAAEAFRSAQAADLEAQEQAEELIKAAEQAQKDARKAENAKANSGGGDYRAVGLRSVWTPALTDPAAALKHYAQRRPDELKAFLLKLAQDDVRAGVRTIPGFVVDETRVPG